MNTQLSSRLGRISAGGSGRAQFSPLLRRLTPLRVTGERSVARVNGGVPHVPPTSVTVEPLGAPTRIRWWDTHVVDRLSMPLTRRHE